MLSVKDLKVGYEDKVIIEKLSIEIQGGEIVTILGPNGSGKSTLLNCLTRYLKPLSGDIYLKIKIFILNL